MYTNETAASNRTILEELFTEGGIRIKRGNLFDWSPGPKPDTFSFDKVEGMLLGVGIGDALGILTEGWLPSLRKQHKGEITDYQKNKYTGEYRGYPSDDSQMTFWTLEQLIADGGYVPANVADAMIKERIIGIGHNVKEYAECRKHGLPWYECGPESAGNGSAMRISPMLIPHLRTGASDLWVDTALSAMTTHNDSFAIASCLALTNMLWQALDMHEPPAAEWWLNTFIDIVRDPKMGAVINPKLPSTPTTAVQVGSSSTWWSETHMLMIWTPSRRANPGIPGLTCSKLYHVSSTSSCATVTISRRLSSAPSTTHTTTIRWLQSLARKLALSMAGKPYQRVGSTA